MTFEHGRRVEAAVSESRIRLLSGVTRRELYPGRAPAGERKAPRDVARWCGGHRHGDNTGGNDLNQSLWDAAISLDPKALQDKDRPDSYGTSEELTSLWASAGLANIEVKNIAFRCGFDSFDDF